MSSKDEKEHYLKLTLAVYKVTDLFPEGDLLRQEIRGAANRVLADLIWSNPHPRVEAICSGVGSLESLFDRAREENLADPRNFLVLKREYKKIAESYKKDADEPVQPKLLESAKVVENSLLNEALGNNGNGRKKKLLNILKTKRRAQVGELVQNFPDISRRTLLRDLEDLYRGGLIIRTGEGRGASYIIKL
jgi:DNA-binding transcriptional ArsR family regulator